MLIGYLPCSPFCQFLSSTWFFKKSFSFNSHSELWFELLNLIWIKSVRRKEGRMVSFKKDFLPWVNLAWLWIPSRGLCFVSRGFLSFLPWVILWKPEGFVLYEGKVDISFRWCGGVRRVCYQTGLLYSMFLLLLLLLFFASSLSDDAIHMLSDYECL